jgi:hypothetical protein
MKCLQRRLQQSKREVTEFAWEKDTYGDYTIPGSRVLGTTYREELSPEELAELADMQRPAARQTIAKYMFQLSVFKKYTGTSEQWKVLVETFIDDVADQPEASIAIVFSELRQEEGPFFPDYGTLCKAVKRAGDELRAAWLHYSNPNKATTNLIESESERNARLMRENDPKITKALNAYYGESS